MDCHLEPSSSLFAAHKQRDELQTRVNSSIVSQPKALLGKIKIALFGDVYRFDNKYARMQSALAKANPDLTLFTGDGLGGNTYSLLEKYIWQTTAGSTSLRYLEKLQVSAAVVGNHDFDYGPRQALELLNKSSFSWLASNIYKEERLFLPQEYLIKKFKLNGQRFKVGIFGLTTDEAQTGSKAGPELQFRNCIETAQKIARFLKETQKVNYVIALTHQSDLADFELQQQVKEIDLIAGGHDHNAISHHSSRNGSWLIKAGKDFERLGIIKLQISQLTNLSLQGPSLVIDTKVQTIDTGAYEANQATLLEIERDWLQLKAFKETFLLQAPLHLSSKREVIDHGQSAMGQLLAHQALASFPLDSPHPTIALLSSKSLQGNKDYMAGSALTIGDLFAELTEDNYLGAMLISASSLKQALLEGLQEQHRVGQALSQALSLDLADSSTELQMKLRKEKMFPLIAGLEVRCLLSAKKAPLALQLFFNGRELEEEETVELIVDYYMHHGKAKGFQRIASEGTFNLKDWDRDNYLFTLTLENLQKNKELEFNNCIHFFSSIS